MAYEEKNYEDDNFSLYSFFKLLTTLVRKWWLIAILIVAFGAGGFLFSKATYTEKYSSMISLNVSNKDKDIAGSASTYSTVSDMQASSMLANNLKYLLTQSNDFLTSVQDIVKTKTGKDISKKDLADSIAVTVISDCTLLEVRVTAGDAETAYAISTAVQSAYAPIAERAFPTGSFSVLDSATQAALQNDQSTVLYTLAAAFVGACIAVLMILITERLRNTLLSSDDIKKNFKINIIASVAKIKSAKSDKMRMLITDRNVGLPFIETFKLIRTKLENVKLKKGYSVFAITSSSESEGKTTCSTNIALSLAKSGKSVLLIDADLRKPAVYKALGIPVGDERDIFDIVAGRKTFEEAVKYVEKYNLYLLISGAPVSEPSEVLASHKMEAIIKEAKKSFDYVIVDCPPAGVVADAAIIANYTDSIVFVAAESKVSLRQMEFALSDLMTTKADILGCIYNCANTHFLPMGTDRSGSGYFSSGYGHYYGSYGGYGVYGTSHKKKH